MPVLRCTNTECQHEWFERSWVAEGADCEECGEPAVLADDDDEYPASGSGTAAAEAAHPAHARTLARSLLSQHDVIAPPTDVHAIARALGLSVHVSHQLGDLSARLIGTTIEVSADEPRVRQRFSIAHEIGHHCLHTTHGAGDVAEQEANAFAGELLVSGPMLREQSTDDAHQLRRLFDVSRDVLARAARTHHVSLSGDR